KELTARLANPELVHGGHVWVPQRCCCARFAHESLARFCAMRSEIAIDNFQRNSAIEELVDRKIGDSHCATAEFPGVAVNAMLDGVNTYLIRHRRTRLVDSLRLSI